MTTYYVDASALVKRYTNEPGSTWIRQVTNSGAQHAILIAEITIAEVAAALGAKQRMPNGITEQQRDRILSRFLQDCEEHYLLLPVDRPVIDRAVELTQRHRLRGYDAVQLATASVAGETLQSQHVPPLGRNKGVGSLFSTQVVVKAAPRHRGSGKLSVVFA